MPLIFRARSIDPRYEKEQFFMEIVEGNGFKSMPDESYILQNGWNHDWIKIDLNTLEIYDDVLGRLL